MKKLWRSKPNTAPTSLASCELGRRLHPHSRRRRPMMHTLSPKALAMLVQTRSAEWMVPRYPPRWSDLAARQVMEKSDWNFTGPFVAELPEGFKPFIETDRYRK